MPLVYLFVTSQVFANIADAPFVAGLPSTSTTPEPAWVRAGLRRCGAVPQTSTCAKRMPGSSFHHLGVQRRPYSKIDRSGHQV